MARILTGSLLFSLILASFATSLARADVEIINFRAEYQNDAVILEWETDFETGLNGFFVTRSNVQFGSYSRISDLIPGEGDEGFGATYDFTDEFVLNDMTYWYRLEAVDNDYRVNYSDLVQVVTSAVHTPTATGATTALATTPASSLTATTFISPGQTSPARTSTPTVQLLPGTVTANTTGPVTLTPVIAATLESTEALSATATLIPLPEITLQFPTPVSNLDISSEGSEMRQGDSYEDQRRNILNTIERVIFIGFIALIWLVLAIWFYISSRRVE